MTKNLDIKSKLLAAQAKRIDLPATPQEVKALLTEREVLLKIAIKLEEQNQEYLQKIATLESQLEEKDDQVIHAVKKENL